MDEELSARLAAAREQWRYRGDERPEFAEEAGPGQESVWDYPRPPKVVADERLVRVLVADEVVAETRSAVRVLETASPPTFYLPRADVRTEYLVPGSGGSFCEWKGQAQYWSVHVGPHRLDDAGWGYPEPLPPYEELADRVSFYPARLTCFVGDERAEPQPGGFYGGWVTSELVGPFKGKPGTEWW